MALAFFALPLEAGVVMSLRTTDHTGSKPRAEDTRMTVAPGLLRMDFSPRPSGDHAGAKPARGPSRTLLFRGGDEASITVLDHREKSFLVLDRESLAGLGSEMRMLLRSTALRVESLSPEQRAVVQKMLESQIGPSRDRPEPPPGTVIRTGDRQVLSGLPCVKHQVFLRGEKLREVWTTPSGEMRGGEQALEVLREMSDFYGTLVTSFESATAGFGAGFALDRHPFDDLRRMNGFPVLTRHFAGGRMVTETALDSVEERQIDLAAFEPPADYLPATPAPWQP